MRWTPAGLRLVGKSGTNVLGLRDPGRPDARASWVPGPRAALMPSENLSLRWVTLSRDGGRACGADLGSGPASHVLTVVDVRRAAASPAPYRLRAVLLPEDDVFAAAGDDWSATTPRALASARLIVQTATGQMSMTPAAFAQWSGQPASPAGLVPPP